MKKFMLVWFTLIFCCFYANFLEAVTRNVPSLSYPTIQSAIDVSGPNDTVLIAPGTYYETLTVLNGVQLVGDSNNPDFVTIDGQGMANETVYVQWHPVNVGWAVFKEATYLLLKNLTIKGGAATGLYSWASDVTITNCIFTQNGSMTPTDIKGGAITASNGSDFVITKSIFHGNYNDEASVIYYDGSQVLSGMAGMSYYVQMHNNRIYNNESNEGILIFEQGTRQFPSVDIFHDDIVDNTVNGTGTQKSIVIRGNYPGKLHVKNSIVWDNSFEPEITIGADVDYCCVETSDYYSGTHWILDDPKFCNRYGYDHHLRPESRCIDAGTWLTQVSDDFTSWPRPWGTPQVTTIGAYERSSIAISFPSGEWPLRSVPLVTESLKCSDVFPDMSVYGYDGFSGWFYVDPNDNILLGRGYCVNSPTGKVVTYDGDPIPHGYSHAYMPGGLYLIGTASMEGTFGWETGCPQPEFRWQSGSLFNPFMQSTWPGQALSCLITETRTEVYILNKRGY